MRLPALPLTLLLLLSAISTTAAPPAQTPPAAPSPVAAPAAPTGHTTTDAGREMPRAPAATFTPSEKLGADSAVAFPVDI
jgi:hypothetical protein